MTGNVPFLMKHLVLLAVSLIDQRIGTNFRRGLGRRGRFGRRSRRL